MMRYCIRAGDFADVYPDIAEKLGITTAPDKMIWSKAVDIWEDYCLNIINNRPAGVRDINHCKLAGVRLGDPLMLDVTAKQMSEYITTHYSNEKSRRTIRSALVMFFTWCEKQKLLREPINGKAMAWEVRKSDKKPIAFLSVEQARALVDNCIAYNQRQKLDPIRTQKYRLALGCAMFLGVRPGSWVKKIPRYGELQNLRWSDWNPKLKTLTIRAKHAKNRIERIMSSLPDNMLTALRDADGIYEADEYICPGNYTNWQNKRKKWATDAGVVLAHDVLRHTFGTYGYWRSLEWALDTGGWDTPAIFFSNYRSKKANAEMADEFFSIPLSFDPS